MEPTEFAELNELLADLTGRARQILGDSFVGAYLQGSFAVGDADMHSDCDFLIPVNASITPRQEAALRVLHDEIPTRDGHWTKHLEGSYPRLEELSSLEGLGARWLYVPLSSATCSDGSPSTSPGHSAMPSRRSAATVPTGARRPVARLRCRRSASTGQCSENARLR